MCDSEGEWWLLKLIVSLMETEYPLWGAAWWADFLPKRENHGLQLSSGVVQSCLASGVASLAASSREKEASLIPLSWVWEAAQSPRSLAESTLSTLGLHEYLMSRVSRWSFRRSLTKLRCWRWLLHGFSVLTPKATSKHWWWQPNFPIVFGRRDRNPQLERWGRGGFSFKRQPPAIPQSILATMWLEATFWNLGSHLIEGKSVMDATQVKSPGDGEETVHVWSSQPRLFPPISRILILAQENLPLHPYRLSAPAFQFGSSNCQRSVQSICWCSRVTRLWEFGADFRPRP